MILTGELVRLRPTRERDAPIMVANLADPELVRYLDHWARLPYGLDDAHAFLSLSPADTVRWAVECRQDGMFLGVTALRDIDHRNRRCTWGIQIGPPSRWGRGYGTEACRLAVSYAFEQLAMAKVVLYFYEGNQRGRRAYEKAGFRLEGVLPRDTWLDGRLVTRYVMAAFRDDLPSRA